ncbi:DUF3078 domain-containing protein [Apibacter muscae]|uniref:DUF3078 domain-containing protein n=1 Tax=Apibacter muscae TaxID=2509004 RepID=UPI0011AB9AEE|nr:DUF3078 domain-containing protein [Apibacter muscae]TWP24036.1 DUF3078 domain-containing protein [Apibacter muscae]
MQKIIYTYIILIGAINLFEAQENKKVDELDSIIVPKKEKHWKIIGEQSLTINQSSFSNWVAGGVNSFGASAKINYSFNYEKGKNIFKNKIILGYGQVSNEKEKPKKTDDVIHIESMYGYKISKSWYSSIASSLITQMANGYNYDADPDYTVKDRKSAFMSPGYITLGLGFEYKPYGKLQISILPVTAKATLILDKKLQKKGEYGLKKDGDNLFMELGNLFTIKYDFDLMKNVSTNNTLSLFSNYLEHVERFNIVYGTIINMKINNSLATKLTFDLIYAHNQVQKVQIKQTFGLGMSYKFQTE